MMDRKEGQTDLGTATMTEKQGEEVGIEGPLWIALIKGWLDCKGGLCQ